MDCCTAFPFALPSQEQKQESPERPCGVNPLGGFCVSQPRASPMCGPCEMPDVKFASCVPEPATPETTGLYCKGLYTYRYDGVGCVLKTNNR